MEHLWNYLKERWNPFAGEITMEDLIPEELAKEDLLKIDAAFELFKESECEALKYQNEIFGNESDPEWRAINLEQLELKQKLTSHLLVISLYHIIEKILKRQLALLDLEVCSKKLKFHEIVNDLKENKNGFDVTKFENYKSMKELQAVANCAKHDIEIDRRVALLHPTFKFHHELPYLGPFLHEKNIMPACWGFIREIFVHSQVN